MHRSLLLVGILLSLSFQSQAEIVEVEPLLGFSAVRAAEQREREASFDAELNAENLAAWMSRLAARPHPVGSAAGRANAEWMVSLFTEWGFDAELAVYDVLFPIPIERRVELLGDEPFIAKLSEPALAEDSSSGQTDEQLPAYNAFSIDGDVTAELVYVNYGIPEDYEELARRGISVAGKIAIARYGGSWRGIKPKLAAENGAIGCLIYSDPRDDGYFRGDVYPKGAYRNENGAQRGSVSDMPLYPGDPLTPGIGSVEGAKRLSLGDAPTITKIPVLPISYGDAEPLLRAMGGQVAPEAWRGALPLTYHLGPGPAKVRLKLAFEWKQVPAYNVIARLEGSERPDQWVMRGNHHDAWVNGAADPISGMISLLEEARVIGKMVQAGWQPKRTIVYGAWDAEEPGLIGSTEWVEHNARVLSQRLVAYINTDGNGRGFLRAGGSHSLERMVGQIAREVIDPQTGVSIDRRARARILLLGEDEEKREALERRDLRLYALGSGSDYTPFLQHLGIASLNLSFGGENGGGSYHSIYDSIDHFNRFGDPGYAYGLALARTAGRATMRIADADVLPFEFDNFAETIGGYVEQISELEQALRKEVENHNRLLDMKAFKLAADPTQPFVRPQPREAVPHLNLAPLRNAQERLTLGAHAYTAIATTALTLSSNEQSNLDVLLYTTERILTSAAGLPRRPWYRHQIYAPGFYTGYGVKTLPGVREAVEQEQWEEATAQIDVVAAAINGIAGRIEEITKRLAEAADE
jgi:N-acetylated-alpha-linked acidic dipeptidase